MQFSPLNLTSQIFYFFQLYSCPFFIFFQSWFIIILFLHLNLSILNSLTSATSTSFESLKNVKSNKSEMISPHIYSHFISFVACNFQCVWMKLIFFHYFHNRTLWMSRFDFWMILFNLSPVAPHIFHPVMYCILIILNRQHIPFTFLNIPKTLILCIIQHFCPTGAIYYTWYWKTCFP